MATWIGLGTAAVRMPAPAWAAWVRCPCGGDLAGSGDGAAVCPDCGGRAERVDGILVFPPAPDPAAADGGADALIRREEAVRDRQARFYDGWLRLHLPSRLERRWLASAVRRRPAAAALELGCGTGRITVELARTGLDVVAVDRSLESLRACRAKLERAGLADRVRLVRADLTQGVVRPGRFDLAVCAQVLQHLPAEALRRRAVEELAAALRPGGRLLASVYAAGPGRAAEGMHAGGIYYRRFRAGEVRSLVSPAFAAPRVRSALGFLHLVDADLRSPGS